MRVIGSVSDMAQACRSLPRPLGLVPTMGYLHPGHLSLVQSARRENASVAVSIFVNPTQFGPKEDLSAYPRDLARDLAILEDEKVDLSLPRRRRSFTRRVWTPGWRLARFPVDWRAPIAPGTFEGVATVVAKLFNVTSPTRAYFGQKDGQQAAVVKAMVRDLNMPVEIVVSPTVREDDGLAYSSRNSRLDPSERRAATVLYRSLQEAEKLWLSGEVRAAELRQRVRSV